MLIRWIYYLTPRLILGIIASVFTAYGALYILNERLFIENMGLFTLTIFLASIAALLTAWYLWTAGGKILLRSSLKRAGIAEENKDYTAGRKLFRRARAIIESSHLIPRPSGVEYRKYIRRCAQFLSGCGMNDSEAIQIYQRYLHQSPGDETFIQRIIPLIMTADYIRRENLPFLSELHHSVPEFTDYTDFLAKQYVSMEIYNADSQDIMLDSIRAESSLKEQCLKFLLPRMLEQERTDPKALEVYLESFQSNLEHRYFKPMMGRVAEKARFEEKPGPLSDMIREAFDSLPKEVREEIRAFIRTERLEQIPLESESKPAFTEEPPPEEAVYKPHRINFTRILLKAGGVLILVISSLFFAVTSGIKGIIKYWRTFRWIGAALVIAAVGFGMAKVIISERSAAVQASLEVHSDKKFTIQVAAFKDRARAEGMMKKMNIRDMKPYLVIAGKNPTWYQIRIGHFDTRSQAQQTANQLKSSKQISDYFVANFISGIYIE